MKKYNTPEMEALALIAQEAITSEEEDGELSGSKLYNDDEFGEW